MANMAGVIIVNHKYIYMELDQLKKGLCPASFWQLYMLSAGFIMNKDNMVSCRQITKKMQEVLSK